MLVIADAAPRGMNQTHRITRPIRSYHARGRAAYVFPSHALPAVGALEFAPDLARVGGGLEPGVPGRLLLVLVHVLPQVFGQPVDHAVAPALRPRHSPAVVAGGRAGVAAPLEPVALLGIVEVTTTVRRASWPRGCTCRHPSWRRRHEQV